MAQVKVAELMAKNVITAQKHHTIDHIRKLMKNNSIHAVPVVDSDNIPVGIVSSKDLSEKHKDTTPVSSIMTEKIYCIPQYNAVHQAARLMRNHKIHHVLVTHEKELVGILSSFDLLKLVEEHRYALKK